MQFKQKVLSGSILAVSFWLSDKEDVMAAGALSPLLDSASILGQMSLDWLLPPCVFHHLSYSICSRFEKYSYFLKGLV
jgi:hypothetical protein